MSSTPKWYCRNKSAPVHAFADISKLGNELRRITKRIVVDVKVDIFSEHDTILDECEKIVKLYWNIQNESKNKDMFSLSKKMKRSPYNALLMKKLNYIMELNERRFFQLTCVLKKTLTFLLRKSMQSEVWFNWALQITHLYNKCHSSLQTASCTAEVEVNANIISNMFPALLLPHKPIDFAYVLQIASQSRVEQNSLDLMFGLFNMSGQNIWRENCESNCSSLEILRILTLNMATDGEFQQFFDAHQDYSGPIQVMVGSEGLEMAVGPSLRNNHTEHFLHKERIFIWQLIIKINIICPSIFGFAENNEIDLRSFLMRGMRLIWSYVGIILDHIILWWIDTPISCFSLTYIESIQNWFYSQTVKDIPEPVYSTLRGIGEILTNFVSTNIWDQFFRLTLISNSGDSGVCESLVQQCSESQPNMYGTPTGTVWVNVFTNLINLSNNYFPHTEIQNSSLMPVAEQIPILHRIDHSVHSMRLWVKEQSKFLCNTWRIDKFFRILEHDVKKCQEVFSTFQLPKLTADLTDILMLVCVALRTKLICEVNANIDKLKKTTDECVQIMSKVCRTLSLANFKLSFPPQHHWQQHTYKDDDKECSQYVGFVLDEIYLPAIKATHDIVILKLILKIICEAWLDHIYQQRIKFSLGGACQLLDDFDYVRDWICNCAELQPDYQDKMRNHEVLRMCKGVGKILLRKPEDIILIKKSPKYDNKSGEDIAQETHLPSEMFVSNQKHWLQLRASKSSLSSLSLCCDNNVLFN